MGRLRSGVGLVSLIGLSIAALTACGDQTHLPQAPSETAFVTNPVSILQQGNADVTMDTSSVIFALDASRALVAHLTLRSTASGPVTITVRGSLYDPGHQLVGDLSGGLVAVAPATTTTIMLTGPTPLGTVASATFEASAQPTPT